MKIQRNVLISPSKKITFEKLYNESTNDFLLFASEDKIFFGIYFSDRNEDWFVGLNIPLDLIDAYQQYVFYRKNQTDLILDESIPISLLIPTIGKARTSLSTWNRRISCYNLLSSCYDKLNRKRCLDWRDICDDENQCVNLEMNKCDVESEFRCRNGLCIRREFLFDGQFDCLDGSDEQLKLINEELCYQFPWIDCEEHLCTRDEFSCGDGQCITWTDRFQELTKCINANDMLYMCEYKAMQETSNDGYCRTTSIYNEYLSCIDTIRHYVALRYESKINLETIKFDLLMKCKTVNQSLPYYNHSYFFSPFINAYITSRHIMESIRLVSYSFTIVPDLFCLGNQTNQCVTAQKLFKYQSIPFDNLFKIKLNNNPCQEYPNDFYQCPNSIECISKYRLLDGYADCLDRSDENIQMINQSIDEIFLQDRYQCKTVPEKIMLHLLGNGRAECSDGSDENYEQIRWELVECNSINNIDCQLLRQANDLTFVNKEFGIQFDDICNSAWETQYGIDEMNCSISGWKCPLNWSQYDRKDTLLWDGNCVPSRSNFFQWPCQNLTTWKLIDLKLTPHLIGDGHIDCLGGQDERNSLTCEDGYQIGERFRCLNGSCIKQHLLCDGIQQCSNGEDESNYYCRHQDNLLIPRICEPGTFDLFDVIIEKNVLDMVVLMKRKCHSGVDLGFRYSRCFHNENSIPPPPLHKEDRYVSSAENLVWFCNRGVVIQSYFPQTPSRYACLCPSSSYGDRYQYQSHRVTVIYTLEMTLEPLKNNFTNIRIITFLQYQYKTIDHMKLSFKWTELRLKRKQRFYLQYPWSLLETIHQASSNDYTIMFHIYTIRPNLVKLFSVHRYPIKYPYLPAYRLTVILNPKGSKSSSNSMINSCGIHSQNCHLISSTTFYCECQSGWYGLQCTEQFQNVSCAANSYFLPTFYNGIEKYEDFLCICPIDRFGRTLADSYYDEKAQGSCLCANNFYDDRCEYKTTPIQILSPSSSTKSFPMILQMNSPFIYPNYLTIFRQHMITMFNTTMTSTYFYSHRQYHVGLLKVYTSYLDYNFYLLWSKMDTTYSTEIVILNETNRCRHAREFENLVPVNKNDYKSDRNLIPFLKRYHQPCQNSNVLCFYDERTYMCLCDLRRHSALCYRYDFQSDQCQFCLNDGICVYRNKHENRFDFQCRCQQCYYGSVCQYRMAQFGYSLESLLVTNDQIDDFRILQNISSVSKIIYLTLSIFMCSIGFLSNLCSILTLLHSTIIRTSIVYLLILTCISNQITLFSLMTQIIYILMNDLSKIKNISFNYILCKSISYTINLFTFISKWAIAFININRLQQSTQIRTKIDQLIQIKRNMLLYLIFMIAVSISIITEMFFHRLLILNKNDDEKSFQCINEPYGIWKTFATVFTFIHHLIPFCFNSYSILKLIYLASKITFPNNSTVSVTTMLADRVAKKDSYYPLGNIHEQKLIDQLYQVLEDVAISSSYQVEDECTLDYDNSFEEENDPTFDGSENEEDREGDALLTTFSLE
ncbi:unnamed protein product [Adineta ricciae]|uniref:Uncharacterized protein n=1 Tax=Adineta ricciae TaxID=249248 RepID=A0A815SC46_ADIRI|nr:unnamed protein product [Adineta ricciae]